ncbi:MAG: hypothetical protein BroJett011_62610 [Chloroflexota bacterium]|nr:MAG: hypothetical protein BroJett011_62610 [Chloroflexota bacterium]
MPAAPIPILSDIHDFCAALQADGYFDWLLWDLWYGREARLWRVAVPARLPILSSRRAGRPTTNRRDHERIL